MSPKTQTSKEGKTSNKVKKTKGKKITPKTPPNHGTTPKNAPTI